jgi:hypothetical protein
MSSKYQTLHTNAGLKVLVISQVPTDKQGQVLTDLYVRIPTADRFVMFVEAGDVVTKERLNKLYQHPDPRLYTPTEQWKKRYTKITVKEGSKDRVGAETLELVTDLYLDLLDNSASSEGNITRLSDIAKEITENIMDDLNVYEGEVLKEMKDISRLEDSYAIRSLTTLMSFACGYTSRKSLIDINAVCMFLDISLLDFRKEDVDNFYKDPSLVSKAFLDAYYQHPSKANLIAGEKLKFVSDIGLQMVLNHHEFHNGNGFPRGVRTKPMTDLVKIVALAVDTFETMKKAELNKKNTSLAIALKQVAELNLEVHKRRHQTNLVSKIMSHLGVSDKIEEA